MLVIRECANYLRFGLVSYPIRFVYETGMIATFVLKLLSAEQDLIDCIANDDDALQTLRRSLSSYRQAFVCNGNKLGLRNITCIQNKDQHRSVPSCFSASALDLC